MSTVFFDTLTGRPKALTVLVGESAVLIPLPAVLTEMLTCQSHVSTVFEEVSAVLTGMLTCQSHVSIVLEEVSTVLGAVLTVLTGILTNQPKS